MTEKIKDERNNLRQSFSLKTRNRISDNRIQINAGCILYLAGNHRSDAALIPGLNHWSGTCTGQSHGYQLAGNCCSRTSHSVLNGCTWHTKIRYFIYLKITQCKHSYHHQTLLTESVSTSEGQSNGRYSVCTSATKHQNVYCQGEQGRSTAAILLLQLCSACVLVTKYLYEESLRRTSVTGKSGLTDTIPSLPPPPQPPHQG